MAAAKSPARLEVVAGPGSGLSYPLTTATVLIGSAEICHIVLRDPGIARVHASIVSHDGLHFLREHGPEDSVDGVETVLAEGSLVTVGATTLRFTCQPVPEHRAHPASESSPPASGAPAQPGPSAILGAPRKS